MFYRLIIVFLNFIFCTYAFSQDDSEYKSSADIINSTAKEIPETTNDDSFPEWMHQYPGLIEKIQAERLASSNPFLLLPHRANYFMPLTYQTKVNQEEQEEFYGRLNSDDNGATDKPELDHYEFVFQLSVKYVIADNILGEPSSLSVAYTNKSFWQAYNESVSAVFRETNHEPEIILGFKPGFSWSDHMTIGLNHQSNGQVGNLSRSWNRIIMSTGKLWPNQILNVRAWYRLPETSKADPSDPSDNDNPDIDDYLGHGDVFYLKKLGPQSLSVMLRNNLDADENKGAIELDWTFPLPGNLKGFVQYFNGYGESLIDYNQYQERVGVGIKIVDWI